jgi:outer membrane receptor for ferrienterochelin and colicin
MMRKSALSLAVGAVLTMPTYAADEQPADLSNIEVRGVVQRLEQSGKLVDVIQKTELISEAAIENKQAGSLAEAIQDEPGIRVSAECSMCGVKRVMLNGMKGEHTTILVDGIPVHSMLSGFYGVDAIPAAGISRIEVARGAGASLIAPEAIGGTINVVTKRPTENGAVIDLATGSEGYRKYSIVGTGISEDGRTTGLLIGQYDAIDQADEDDNGVNEAPQLDNYNIGAKLSHDITDRDNLELRLGQAKSEVFGGPVLGDTTNSVAEALANYSGDPTFIGNDVREGFTGEPGTTTEWIETRREEVALRWTREIDADTNVVVTGSMVEHIQDSYYEGIDYYADDDSLYFDLRINRYFGDHLLTLGADMKNEEMRSHSRAMEDNPNFVSDSFDYDTHALYLQDTWTPSAAFELQAALRVDQLSADFVDPSKDGTEIDETMAAPRIHMRYSHNDNFTSRVSAGRGYRAPLAFFETDHGVLDAGAGFNVDIDELEKSTSVGYALSYESPRFTSTFSTAWARVDNLAMLEEIGGVPTLVNADEAGTVITTDLVVGYQLSPAWSLGASFENFDYDDDYKSTFGIAPVEQRIRLTTEYAKNGWSFTPAVTWIGDRDLNDYGYEGWNDQDDVGDDSAKKSTDADAFYTVDLKVSKELNKTFTAYIGVNNLLDYTQAGDEDSPLFYDADGGYDVGYIYGPLRGRTMYTGLKAVF